MKNISVLDLIICPTCGGRLYREGRSLVCRMHHTFDVARSGYVNLLPPGKEKNSHTGDERKMIAARSDFLSHGHYAKISSSLASLIPTDGTDESFAFCDMGSGEGRHTLNIVKTLASVSERGIIAIGADASKYGAECASKLAVREGFMPCGGIGAECDLRAQAYFIPANIFHLPVQDGSLDACVSMFAPIAWDEVRRTLKDGGVLAVASSGADHLMEMRRIIYDEVREADFSPAAADGFKKIREESLTYHVRLSTAAEIENLFMMTPFYYRTAEEGKARLLARDSLDLTVNVKFTLFSKEK